MDLGYARVSTAKQDLERQIDALRGECIPLERIYIDKKSGATTDRPGLTDVLRYARSGDVIVVHTLDRLGRTVRDTLNLIHDLAESGVGIKNLADPIKVDSSNPDDPMAQLAVVMLALFAQMERTYMLERAAHARAVATANGRQSGRPTVVDPTKLAYAVHLRATGHHGRHHHQDRNHPLQPLPAPPTSPPGSHNRGRRRRRPELASPHMGKQSPVAWPTRKSSIPDRRRERSDRSSWWGPGPVREPSFEVANER